jgi:predicted DsbA family dithiol-disulfide isomerase
VFVRIIISGDFNNKRLLTLAQTLNLNTLRFGICLFTRSFQSEIDKDVSLAQKWGVYSVPMAYVNGHNVGPIYTQAYEQIHQAIIEAATK